LEATDDQNPSLNLPVHFNWILKFKALTYLLFPSIFYSDLPFATDIQKTVAADINLCEVFLLFLAKEGVGKN